MKNRILRLIGWIIVAAVIALVVRQLLLGWPAVSAHPWQLRPLYLLGSLALMQSGYLLLARAWRSVLRGIGLRLSLGSTYWLFLISNLGRYLPGKVWQIGAAAVLGRRLGLSGRDVAASMIVYQLYLIPSGAVLVLLFGPLPAPYGGPGFQALAWALVAALLFLALWPHRVLRLVGPLARRAGIEPERWRIELRRRLFVALQCGVAWALLALGFALFVLSVTPLADRLLLLGRVFIASYLIGYLAIVAPGGLGVREGALAILLGPLLGPGPAAGLALLSRLWITVSELLALAPALYLARRDGIVPELARRWQSPPPA